MRADKSVRPRRRGGDKDRARPRMRSQPTARRWACAAGDVFFDVRVLANGLCRPRRLPQRAWAELAGARSQLCSRRASKRVRARVGSLRQPCTYVSSEIDRRHRRPLTAWREPRSGAGAPRRRAARARVLAARPTTSCDTADATLASACRARRCRLRVVRALRRSEPQCGAAEPWRRFSSSSSGRPPRSRPSPRLARFLPRTRCGRAARWWQTQHTSLAAGALRRQGL